MLANVDALVVTVLLVGAIAVWVRLGRRLVRDNNAAKLDVLIRFEDQPVVLVVEFRGRFERRVSGVLRDVGPGGVAIEKAEEPRQQFPLTAVHRLEDWQGRLVADWWGEGQIA